LVEEERDGGYRRRMKSRKMKSRREWGEKEKQE
jgi:hypothetical protein